MAATRSWETQQRLQALNAVVRERLLQYPCLALAPLSQPIGPGTCYPLFCK
jgi:hypothetical protein